MSKIKFKAIIRIIKSKHFLLMIDSGWVASVPSKPQGRQNELMVSLGEKLEEFQAEQDAKKKKGGKNVNTHKNK